MRSQQEQMPVCEGAAQLVDVRAGRPVSDGVQIFLQTDLFSAGLLILGQSIELNWTTPR